MQSIKLLIFLCSIILVMAHPTLPPTNQSLNTTQVNKVQHSNIPPGLIVTCGIMLIAAGGVEYFYELDVDHGWFALSDLVCYGWLKYPHCEHRYEYQSISQIHAYCQHPCHVGLDNGDLYWAYNSILLPGLNTTAIPPAPVAALCCGDCTDKP